VTEGNSPPVIVEGLAVCLACGLKSKVEAEVRTAFVDCPHCGEPSMFMYRGGQKIS
jgi:predicted RNA-binding Zn-ribbon protein involved in translation (DUF1610 family)